MLRRYPSTADKKEFITSLLTFLILETSLGRTLALVLVVAFFGLVLELSATLTLSLIAMAITSVLFRPFISRDQRITGGNK